MLDLMGSRSLAGAAKRREYLGLSQHDADRAVDVLDEVLAGGKRLTRAQCLEALRDAGIEVGGQRGYHLLWYTSQRGVTCFAPNIGTEQAFMKLDDFVPDPHQPDPEEALATIALRYFRSHGPTTAKDFAGWTGLPVTVCRRGIAAAGDALTPVAVDGVPMVADRALVESYAAGETRGRQASRALALPGFDEYLLGYKERAFMLAPEHLQAIIPGGNGVFQPTVVRDGRVVGTWRRTVRRSRVEITVTELERLAGNDRRAIEAAFQPYGAFLGLPATVTWPAPA
jgi:hypothetical protein